MESNYSIISAQNVKMSLPFASIGDRIIAYIIDILILFGYVFLIFFLIGDASIVTYILLIPFIIYHPLCEYLYDGRSVGKSLMKIQVASLDGSPLTLSKILIRWVFRLVDFNLFSGLVALISAALSDKNQRLGDMVAQTVVISEKYQPSVQELNLPDWSEHELSYPNAHLLSSSQVQLIRDTIGAYGIESRAELVTELGKKVAKKLQLPPPHHPYKFLKTVLKDYAYLKEHQSYN